MDNFSAENLKELYKPNSHSSKTDNGQITIVGGSKLFHGAPLFALKTAARVCDMVFFASPEPSLGEVASNLKANLSSFIWIPWEELDRYIEKSDAVLIGPGFMRATNEEMNKIHQDNPDLCDDECQRTREITERLLLKFKSKKWVIDAGSLQVMDKEWIPEKSILTPNSKEFEKMFALKMVAKNISDMAKKHKCVIVAKGPQTIVCGFKNCVLVSGGNAGLTKGGTGDVLAGLSVALLAKNDAFLAAGAASYISKLAADKLYEEVGPNFSSDDLADAIPRTFWQALHDKI